MKQFFFFIIFLFLFSFFFFPRLSLAAENPLSTPNNKIGIHILFPQELEKAAALVNSNGGDWGYVVIPIQSGDKDLVKWQTFFDNAKKFHVIPLIRLATEGDFFNTKVWRKPTAADVLDFANFLNSLSWPTKNKYIIMYNEVNRGDEWGGTPNPEEYANLLSYAVSVFKTRSTDFFLISSGMDNAAANSEDSMNEYDFLSGMNTAVPGIFNQIDGLGSHSYPNPAFSQPPSSTLKTGILSFEYEKQLIGLSATKSLPTFITETGWDQSIIGTNLAAQYLSTAFRNVWNDSNVAVVAPFLLQAGAGPFTQFSFLDVNGNPNAVYAAMQNIGKTKGTPMLNSTPSATVLAANTENPNYPPESFSPVKEDSFPSTFESGFKSVFKWLLQVK